MTTEINTDGNIIYIYIIYKDIKICREVANNKYTNINREIRKAKKFAKYIYRSKELLDDK